VIAEEMDLGVIGAYSAQECKTFKAMCRSSKRGYINCLYNNNENDKPSQGYNMLKLYKCIVGLQLEYYIQVA